MGSTSFFILSKTLHKLYKKYFTSQLRKKWFKEKVYKCHRNKVLASF